MNSGVLEQVLPVPFSPSPTYAIKAVPRGLPSPYPCPLPAPWSPQKSAPLTPLHLLRLCLLSCLIPLSQLLKHPTFFSFSPWRSMAPFCPPGQGISGMVWHILTQIPSGLNICIKQFRVNGQIQVGCLAKVNTCSPTPSCSSQWRWASGGIQTSPHGRWSYNHAGLSTHRLCWLWLPNKAPGSRVAALAASCSLN